MYTTPKENKYTKSLLIGKRPLVKGPYIKIPRQLYYWCNPRKGLKVNVKEDTIRYCSFRRVKRMCISRVFDLYGYNYVSKCYTRRLEDKFIKDSIYIINLD